MARRLWSVAACLPVVALAQSDSAFECTRNDIVRRVEIVYETEALVPCEVRYFKLTEAPGRHEVLWRAQNESGYCESRARSFVAELEGWGWQCEATTNTAAPGAEDDTDVLGAPENE